MRKLYSNVLLILFVALAAPACLAEEKLDTAPIVAALIEVANDADMHVRNAAFDALQKQPRSEELVELFWRGLDDEYSQTQSLCLSKVVEFEGPTEKVLTQLIELLTSERRTGNDLAMQRQAERHLIALGAPAIPHLMAAVKEGEATAHAISTLGRIRLGEYRTAVTTQLTALLKSEDKGVRITAVRSLQSIMSTAAKAEADAQQAKARRDHYYQQYLAVSEKLIGASDSNGDGALTEEEWSKLSKWPAAADSDGDGRITPAEYASWALESRKKIGE